MIERLCGTCGHPEDSHDAGECLALDHLATQCKCVWAEFSEVTP